jgi:hypothetical protein
VRTPRSLLREYAAPLATAAPVAGSAAEADGLVPSAFARRILEEAG